MAYGKLLYKRGGNNKFRPWSTLNSVFNLKFNIIFCAGRILSTQPPFVCRWFYLLPKNQGRQRNCSAWDKLDFARLFYLYEK